MPLLPRLVLIALLSAGAAVGCATPAPLVRLSPRNVREITWVAGRAVLERESAAGIRVAAAFEQQDGNLLGLRLEIANGSLSRIEVKPADITFMTCPDAVNATCRGSYAVVDPEDMLLAFDVSQARERADAANQQAFSTGLVLLSAVGDVASIASGRSNRTTGLQTAAIAHEGNSAAARSEATLSRLASGREQWSNAAFRRSTIVAGGGAAGLIYLPITMDAQYVWLHVRAGGEIFPFGFKQSVREFRGPARNDARR